MREKQIRKIKELLGREKEIFSGQKMKTVSVAGYGLLQWVLAMVEYYEVFKLVEPKKKLVEDLQQQMEDALAELKSIKKELGELQETLAKLEKDEKEKKF